MSELSDALYTAALEEQLRETIAENTRLSEKNTAQGLRMAQIEEDLSRMTVIAEAAGHYMMSCLCNGGTDEPSLNRDIHEKWSALLVALREHGGFSG